MLQFLIVDAVDPIILQFQGKRKEKLLGKRKHLVQFDCMTFDFLFFD